MDARTPLQPAVVTAKQALPIKPFGLDMQVLLTTEATGFLQTPSIAPSDSRVAFASFGTRLAS